MSGCANCRHSATNVGPDKSIQRHCRRYPPQVNVIPVPVQGIDGRVGINVQVMALYPTVADDATCGEFAPQSLSS